MVMSIGERKNYYNDKIIGFKKYVFEIIMNLANFD